MNNMEFNVMFLDREDFEYFQDSWKEKGVCKGLSSLHTGWTEWQYEDFGITIYTK